MVKNGVFTVSLDFELYWGVRDHRSLADYGANILGVRQAVPRLLRLFEKYEIHATWATVGYLFFDKKTDLLTALPPIKPEYKNRDLSPYLHLEKVGASENEDPYHFGRSLVENIKKTPFQEVGTHTFSHYYCLEPGQTKEAFRADLIAAKSVAERAGISLKSLVFPRNQFNEDYLSICREVGLQIYRGNQNSWIYEPRDEAGESLWRRAVRLADAYVNLTGCHAATIQEVRGSPKNLPASRFLRPYSHILKAFEPLRLRRIQKELDHACRHNKIYHLWWHPHNFGRNLEENISFLENVLGRFADLRARNDMVSLNMGEVANL